MRPRVACSCHSCCRLRCSNPPSLLLPLWRALVLLCRPHAARDNIVRRQVHDGVRWPDVPPEGKLSMAAPTVRADAPARGILHVAEAAPAVLPLVGELARAALPEPFLAAAGALRVLACMTWKPRICVSSPSRAKGCQSMSSPSPGRHHHHRNHIGSREDPQTGLRQGDGRMVPCSRQVQWVHWSFFAWQRPFAWPICGRR